MAVVPNLYLLAPRRLPAAAELHSVCAHANMIIHQQGKFTGAVNHTFSCGCTCASQSQRWVLCNKRCQVYMQ